MINTKSQIIYTLVIISALGLLLMVTYAFRHKIIHTYYLQFWKAERYISHNQEEELLYRIYEPKTQAQEKLPLLLYLHPFGQGGSNNKSQIHGLINEWVKKDSQSLYPCYIIAPQCPSGKEWAEKGPMSIPFKHYRQDDYPIEAELLLIKELIEKLKMDKAIDPERIYVIGHSMGATGAWEILTRFPEYFTAAIISSGVSDTSKAELLINTPIWAFSGDTDNIAPYTLNQTMTEKINSLGGKAKFTLLKGTGHNMGHIAFEYDGVKKWLFDQKKQ